MDSLLQMGGKERGVPDAEKGGRKTKKEDCVPVLLIWFKFGWLECPSFRNLRNGVVWYALSFSAAIHCCRLNKPRFLVSKGITLRSCATYLDSIETLFDAPTCGCRCVGPLLSHLAAQLAVQNPCCCCRSPPQPVNATICIVHSITYS